MATLFAKTAGGNFNTANTWSNVNAGGADNSGPPTAADDVVFELLSGNVSIDTSSVCRSIDCTSGTGNYTGTLTHNAGVNFNIGDGTAGAGNVALKFSNGMTFTLGSTTSPTITFKSTSATQQTIDYAGKTSTNNVWNSASNGNYAVTSAINSASATVITVTQGTVHFDGAADTSGLTHGVGIFQSNNSNTRSIFLGTATFNLSAGSAWQMATVTGLTLTQGTSTINCTGASVSFDGGGKTFATVNFTGSGVATISSVNTFTNLGRTGTAAVGDALSFAGNQTVSGNFTLAGNSAGANRLQVRSSIITTTRTITNTGATQIWSNVDLRDITLSTSYNASAITGNSGNEGGNTNITFTTAQTNYYQTAVNDSFSTTAKWFLATNGAGGAGRVPLPQDTAIFDVNSVTASGKTITCDLAYLPFSTDFTGVANTPNFTTGASMGSLYGSLNLTGTGTFTQNSNLGIAGRLANSTIMSAGKQFTNTVFNTNGFTLTQLDAFNTNGFINFNTGTWDTGSFNLTLASTAALNCTLLAGSSTITVTGTGTIWSQPGGGSVLTMGTSTIVVSDTGASNKTFQSGAKTYYRMNITGGGAGIVIFSGAATWDRFPQITGATTKSIRFTNGVTTTFTNGTNFGNGSSVLTIDSTSAGSAATTAVTNGAVGVVNCDFLSLKDNTASGPTPFYAGANSTNVSGNTNWTFTAAPSTGSGNFMLMGVG